MRYIIKHKTFILFLTVLWCIMNGNFLISTIFSGCIFSSLSVIISCHLPDGEQYIHSLNISFFRFIKFIFILFINIYKSAFYIIKLILMSNINPRLETVNTTLKNDWSIFFLANAITLTPGTVTINRHGNTLTILTTTDTDTIINKSIEKTLRKGVRH
ncbi:MAG: Na+/H+ antiporter subunit E [Vallitalea sp.]|nr:Na+/H+ antiporter subunit E [Vallitalea sp.]